jgi:hypothetical protein
MDLIIENVGRRSSTWSEQGSPTDVGDNSLNGYERNVLFWNRGDEGFVDVGYLTRSNRIEDGRGVAVADFDRDGRLDLAIQNLDEVAALLMGRGETGNWLQVELDGAAPNREAIGAIVRIEAAGRTQVRQVAAGSGFLASSERVLHFGLGSAESVDSLEVRWPSGQRERYTAVGANQRMTIRQSEPGTRQANR